MSFIATQLIGFGAASSSGGSFTTTFSTTLTGGSAGGFDGYSARIIIPASSLTTSGSTIRVTFEAHATLSTIINHASIGPRSGSTAGFASAPSELLFSGVSGCTISGGGSIVSDPLAFSLNETLDYLINIDWGDTGGNAKYNNPGLGGYFLNTTTDDQYNVTSGSGWNSDLYYHVTLIEVA